MEDKKIYSAIDLQTEMMKSAMSVMTANYSEVIDDFRKVEEISEKKHDAHFYWTVWSTGTQVHNKCSEMKEFQKECGHKILISALVGRHAGEDSYEIVYA